MAERNTFIDSPKPSSKRINLTLQLQFIICIHTCIQSHRHMIIHTSSSSSHYVIYSSKNLITTYHTYSITLALANTFKPSKATKIDNLTLSASAQGHLSRKFPHPTLESQHSRPNVSQFHHLVPELTFNAQSLTILACPTRQTRPKI